MNGQIESNNKICQIMIVSEMKLKDELVSDRQLI